MKASIWRPGGLALDSKMQEGHDVSCPYNCEETSG